MASFDGVGIYQNRQLFTRTNSGKGWKRKPDESTGYEHITPEQYRNAISWHMRGDRTEYGYTYAGYTPVKITTYSPDGSAKMVFSWYFTLYT